MPSALVLYQFFHPDDVVSAQHFTDLCVELNKRGWKITARPCNRGCRNPSETYPLFEEWAGISIRRVWRPAFPQHRSIGRVLNALWMIWAWSFSSATNPDVVVVGTDPILSVVIAKVWRLFRPKVRIVHWCFDLYPEAAIADGHLRATSPAVRWLKRLLASSYSACDCIIDIGECMRRRLVPYGSKAVMRTLTPWALVEPPAALEVAEDERRRLFGDAKLALMYSGNFGRAHSWGLILELARLLRNHPVRFVFSVRGNRADELRQAVGVDDTNVAFVPFASQDRIEQRLSSADIQIVSLNPEWTGTVVPSKFFGALAVGRPVLFVGSPDSSVAKWIIRYELGWVVTDHNLKCVAKQMVSLLEDPFTLIKLFERCHSAYRDHFSKEFVCNEWNRELRSLLSVRSH